MASGRAKNKSARAARMPPLAGGARREAGLGDSVTDPGPSKATQAGMASLP